MREPEFRKLLGDYIDEISDPKNKAVSIVLPAVQVANPLTNGIRNMINTLKRWKTSVSFPRA